MATKQYDFTDKTLYSYNSDEIEWKDNKFQLKLQQDNQDFTEDFADDTGHTYDNTKAEFKDGGIEQKDQRPEGATFAANYNLGINGNWGNGILTGTPYNGASASGGKLDLSGSANKYLDYDADLNADSQQTGCIRFKWTPKYSGSGSFQYLFTLVEGIGVANNRIRIYHQSTLLFVAISDSVGGSIVSVAETFSPVADTEYEIELNWDITTGATRLFVNGTQLGSTQTGTGTRSANIGLLRLGKDLNGNGNADFLIDDFIYFDTVQHTANYTPGYIISDYIYSKSIDIVPEMSHVGVGTIKLFNSLLTTYSGTIGILLEIGRSGNNLYFNGSTWAISSDPYTQYTDPVTFNTNCGSLPVDGEEYGQFTIVFFDSNTQASISNLIANMSVDIGYLTTNPYLEIISALEIDALLGFSATITKTGSDAIQFIAKKDNDYRYVNVDTWENSDESYLQTNLYSLINTYVSTFISNRANFKWRAYLHSDDGQSTPALSGVSLSYRYIDVIVGTNSWVSFDDADDYMEDRFNNSIWESAIDENKAKSLITAFKWLYNSQKFNIPLTSTAQIVKDAQTELANYILVNFEEFEKRRALQSQGVENFKVLKWQEKFIKDADIPQFINDMLTDYVMNKGGVFFTVDRNLSGNRR